MSRRPVVRIVTPSLVPYDAISNDVAQMRAELDRCGYRADVFAETIHPDLAGSAYLLASANRRVWRRPEDILIYHHSMAWPTGEKILFESQNRIVIRYHNITPPRFFAPYSTPHEEACRAGLDSTKRLASIPDAVILAASRFNCADFTELGVPPSRCHVLAPLHLTEELWREDFDLTMLQRYSGDFVNILFVGGIKPNKGHARSIRVFTAYHHNFNRRSRLIFAGGMDPRLGEYVQDLRRLADDLGVSEQVVFTGPVTARQIKTLYVKADVFLCTSEHEGFCVPLVEAMYFRTPIVAWGVTAVPETLGDAGILHDDWDEMLFARQIASVVADTGIAGRLGEMGRKRYRGMFSPDGLRGSLVDFIGELGLPDRAGRGISG